MRPLDSGSPAAGLYYAWCAMNRLALLLGLILLTAGLHGQAREPDPAEFMKRSAVERLEIWRKSHGFEIDNLVIARGQDMVPGLVKLIRRGKGHEAERAAGILCSMDRYVPADSLPLPEFKAAVEVRALGIRGRLDPFNHVDGRRIGPEGVEALRWASTAKNNSLRFAAAYCLGALTEKFRQLSLADQISVWRKTVADCNRWNPPCSPWKPETFQLWVLAELIATGPADPLPELIRILKTEENGFVRWEVFGVLRVVHNSRTRLGQTESGRQALDAATEALDLSNPKRFFPFGLVKWYLPRERENEWRTQELETFRKMRDPQHISSSLQTDLTIFVAYAKSKGVVIPCRHNEFSGVVVPGPELLGFLQFLSERNPDFPGWEYGLQSHFMSGEQLAHPRFTAKMERLLEQWRAFRAAGAATN